ncbi:vitelline membrane protein Vm26Ab-like [Musca domestica]|uniref:Vitelline membrane protein Vm26Ab-like n=1 Tax=Musca domestica TaxID=7370 RepID=A0ABM3V5A0_MUSDO|nr:vitelline membrane protein Vm26Ab-like [Musca domestica]
MKFLICLALFIAAAQAGVVAPITTYSAGYTTYAAAPAYTAYSAPAYTTYSAAAVPAAYTAYSAPAYTSSLAYTAPVAYAAPVATLLKK